MKSKIVFVFVLVLPAFRAHQTEVITNISNHIGKIALECQREMGLKRDVIEEFLAFWNPKHELKSTSQGCAIACVLKNMDVLEGGQIKTDNAFTFLKRNGADPEMSSKILELFNQCTHAASTKNFEDGCDLGLQIFKCLRYGIFRLHWAPKIDDGKNELPADDVRSDFFS